VYLPDVLDAEYQKLLVEFNHEFTYTFGGATILRGLDGSYLSHRGLPIRDRVNLIWTDTHFSFQDHFDLISHYVDELQQAAMAALHEEAVLIVAYPCSAPLK
jgi:hypothetical protein